MNWAVTRIGGRFHYGWLAAAVVFLILLAAPVPPHPLRPPCQATSAARCIG